MLFKRKKVFYIKSLQVDVEVLSTRAISESAKKELEMLAETMKYYSQTSTSGLVSLERNITIKVAELEANISDSVTTISLCKEIHELLSQRHNASCFHNTSHP